MSENESRVEFLHLSKEAADEERGAVLWQEGGRGGRLRPLRSVSPPSPPPSPPPPSVRSNRSPTAEVPPTDGSPLLTLRDIRIPWWWWLPIPERVPYLFIYIYTVVQFFVCLFVCFVLFLIHKCQSVNMKKSVKKVRTVKGRQGNERMWNWMRKANDYENIYTRHQPIATTKIFTRHETISLTEF